MVNPMFLVPDPPTSPARTGQFRRHRTRLAWICGIVVALVPVSAAGAAEDLAPVEIVIGAKNFPGALVLSQLYGQALAAEGALVTFDDQVGPTEDAFAALQRGDLDAYAEYQGTLLEFLGGNPSNDTKRTHRALQEKLAPLGLVATAPAPALDVNGFYVSRSTARRHDLTTVSDLKKVAPRLVIGGPPECELRPLCLGTTSDRVYGLEFESVRKLDAGGPETVRALRRGDVDVAVLFTGSSDVPRNAVLLRDDKGLQPAENPVLVLRDSLATPEVVQVVDAASAALTTPLYRGLAIAVSERQRDPSIVAAEFLAERSLT
jgi:osmoprotectant transport system substrate-binding protein